MEFLKLFGAIFLVFGASFFMLNIRYWLGGKELKGTCAGSFKVMNNGETQICNVCGRRPDEVCGNVELEQKKG
jgi:hypothetical protein